MILDLFYTEDSMKDKTPTRALYGKKKKKWKSCTKTTSRTIATCTSYHD
jgi:hypothetical protein